MATVHSGLFVSFSLCSWLTNRLTNNNATSPSLVTSLVTAQDHAACRCPGWAVTSSLPISPPYPILTSANPSPATPKSSCWCGSFYLSTFEPTIYTTTGSLLLATLCATDYADSSWEPLPAYCVCALARTARPAHPPCAVHSFHRWRAGADADCSYGSGTQADRLHLPSPATPYGGQTYEPTTPARAMSPFHPLLAISSTSPSLERRKKASRPHISRSKRVFPFYVPPCGIYANNVLIAALFDAVVLTRGLLCLLQPSNIAATATTTNKLWESAWEGEFSYFHPVGLLACSTVVVSLTYSLIDAGRALPLWASRVLLLWYLPFTSGAPVPTSTQSDSLDFHASLAIWNCYHYEQIVKQFLRCY